MCRVLIELLSRNRLVNPRLGGWVLFLVLLCPALLAFASQQLFFFFSWLATRFLGQRLFLIVCLQRVQLKVCNVSWKCSEGSPNTSSPTSDLASGLPAGKACNPDMPRYRNATSSIPRRRKGTICHVLVAAPLPNKEGCKNQGGRWWVCLPWEPTCFGAALCGVSFCSYQDSEALNEVCLL